MVGNLQAQGLAAAASRWQPTRAGIGDCAYRRLCRLHAEYKPQCCTGNLLLKEASDHKNGKRAMVGNLQAQGLAATATRWQPTRAGSSSCAYRSLYRLHAE